MTKLDAKQILNLNNIAKVQIYLENQQMNHNTESIYESSQEASLTNIVSNFDSDDSSCDHNHYTADNQKRHMNKF